MGEKEMLTERYEIKPYTIRYGTNEVLDYSVFDNVQERFVGAFKSCNKHSADLLFECRMKNKKE
jgi:hypothetical protein